MAFATKYRFNIYGQPLVNTYWKVDLQVDGYGGSVLSQDIADSSFYIRQEGEGGGKFATSGGSVVRGTTAGISIQIEDASDLSEFMAFATIGEQEWKMLIYKGTAPGNEVLYHELFVQPDVFSFAYEDFPYFISITATDEIGRLSGIKFYQSGTTQYTARNTIMYFIFEALNKLGIQRAIREVCNIYSDEMAATASDSPLMQATIDPAQFILNKGQENETVMDCHTVLNELLKPFALVLTLGKDNRWFLRRPTELAASSYVQRILTDATTVASSATVSNHLKTTNAEIDTSIMTFINNGLVTVDWRWKRMVLKYLLGDADNLIIDGDFAPSKWTDINTLANWSTEFRFPAFGGSLTYERVQLSELKDYQSGHFLPGNIGSSTVYTFTVSTLLNRLLITDALDGEPSPFKVGDKIYFSKAFGSTLPTPLADWIPYWITDIFYAESDVDTDPDITQIKVATSDGGESIVISTTGSGTFYVGFSKEATLSYAAQLNGYQTALWSDDVIDDKGGIKSTAVDVVAGNNNAFEIAFWWKILFNNTLVTQANAAEAYYEVRLVGSSATYYYSKATGSWGTAKVVNTLSDARLRYEWSREKVQPASFPVTGDLFLILYTPSSASNTDTAGIQYALIESQFIFNGDVDVEYIQKTAEIGADYAYEAPEVEVLFGDAPSSVYRGYVGIGQALTNNWYRRGVTEERQLLDLMMQAYMNNYGRTTLKISGTLMGDYDAEQLIEDDNLDYEREGGTVTPRFMLNGGTYYPESAVWQGEWLEINE